MFAFPRSPTATNQNKSRRVRCGALSRGQKLQGFDMSTSTAQRSHDILEKGWAGLQFDIRAVSFGLASQLEIYVFAHMDVKVAELRQLGARWNL